MRLINRAKNATTRARWHPLELIGFLLLVVLVVLPFASERLGRIEGYFAPTTLAFTIDDVRAIEVQDALGEKVTHSVVSGGLFVVRPECQFQRVVWNVFENGRMVTARIKFPVSKARGYGPHEYGPWVIDVSPRLIPHSLVEVHQSCPWRPYETITRLIPPLDMEPPITLRP